MGDVSGVGPQGPKPTEAEEADSTVQGAPPSKGGLPEDPGTVSNKWSDAVKKFPALLDAVMKGLAMQIMKDSRKHAQKLMKRRD